MNGMAGLIPFLKYECQEDAWLEKGSKINKEKPSHF